MAPHTSFAKATSRARRVALFLFSVAALLTGSAEAVRGQSALDGFDPNANGGIRVIVVQPDGKILLGGDFTTLTPNGGATVSRNYIARLNPDGALDTAFDPSADGSVLSIVVQTDGKVVAGGNFTSIGGQPRSYLARLDGTTGLADSFDPGPNGSVRAVAVQADGKILAGGYFGMVGGVERFGIARFDGTTGLLDSFDPGAEDAVFSIVLQADGKILVGGRFINIGGEMRRGIARLDPTTGHADSFDPSVETGGFSPDDVYAIAIQADGKILLGGSFIDVGGEGRVGIARVDPTTGHADSFNPSANEIVYSIAVQPDGRILAAGNFTSIGGQPRNYIARLSPVTGQADSFDPHPSVNVATIAVQPDGKVLAGGYFTLLAPNGGATLTRNRIARLEADGRLDQTLDLNADAVLATAMQPDGKILIGGGFTHVLGVTRNHIARLNTDGTLDTAFNPNANNAVIAIAVQADGTILAGGAFTSIGGQGRNRIARLDATTGLADSFDPNANDQVHSIAVQADDRILAAGNFNGANSIGGQTRNRIARLDPTTGLADSFDPNASGIVSSIAVQADGKILAGGDFMNIGGQPRPYLARLDSITGLADSFNATATAGVFAIALQADGKILVGGIFNGPNSIGGQFRNCIARLDPTTGLADSFNPRASMLVQTIAVQADGKILAGGYFHGTNSIGGQPRNYIARLDPTTGLADSFNPNADENVYSIAVQADGKILAGGFFSSIGGQTRSGFARLSNDTAAGQDLAVTRTAMTWTRGGSSPHLSRATFESSTNNVNYTPLGNGTAAGNNWILTGLDLPTGHNIYVRARGYYRGGDENGSTSLTESVRNVFLTPPTKAINVSTRMLVQTGENVGIGGFIISGSTPKQVLIRGIGPSLTLAGVPNALNDPTLELFNPAHSIAYNNDWQDTDGSAIRATGLSPFSDLEAALLVTLSPGNYTAVVRGNNGGTGVALVEVYDLNQGVDSKLANLSTRAFVSTNDDIVIAGCTLGGDGDDRIVVRGIGPSLAAFGVTNALANPTLELRDSHGALLASNNDWQDDAAQAAELTAAGLAPSSNLEAAIAVTLPPGPYTALLSGRNNTTGVGVVEIYDRGAP